MIVLGLAAQQTLGNLFAGIVLQSTRPFRVGERVRLLGGPLAGSIEGTVSSLGLFYATLVQGADRLLVPNGVLLNLVVVPLREPAKVDVRARFGDEANPQEVERRLLGAITVPTRYPPHVALEEIDDDASPRHRCAPTTARGSPRRCWPPCAREDVSSPPDAGRRGGGRRPSAAGAEGGRALRCGTRAAMAAERQDDQQPQSTGPGPQEQLASEARLWARFVQQRDPATREELVNRYLPFARSLTRRYRTANESFDDLLQVASLGLVNAIDRFDPDRGIPFTAFASPTILGELKRHFRDRVWTVRVPRGLHDRMADVSKAIGELTEELQRSPAVGEIAERLDLDEIDVLEVLEANHNRRPLSLDRPANANDPDETPASEWIGAEDEGYELVEGKVALDAALPHLDERERLVLRLRFVEDMTQSQIAEQIGHSQMHVSRILRRTLQRIREQIEEEGQPSR